MKQTILATLCVVLLFWSTSSSTAQDAQEVDSATSVVVVNPPPPKTRLQAMAEQKGALIIAGFTDVGTVTRDDGAFVRVTAAQYTNTVSNVKQMGILIFIHQVEGGARETRSYIDDDEIDTLLSSMDSMSKLDRTATPMNDFDARFRTRGDLEICNININGGRAATFRGVEILSSSGQEVWAETAFPLARLGEVQQYLTSAKQIIDRAKNSAAPDNANK